MFVLKYKMLAIKTVLYNTRLANTIPCVKYLIHLNTDELVVIRLKIVDV